ncbi:polyisoprenoid-binding protein YceI [Psychromicrobium silvestre]|uniref:Polyisoprenoid-binding protein YceI n=1 Tax=Psychromicrobium silvestre TaxID=1645614 RepID=A0A7Y9LTW8_9MICC|nr:YceI family protein [Psychromicrobium silvestre]NYE95543.1 polyisoprenoid-binding protein YceI [Psychromicrobium silvestre]
MSVETIPTGLTTGTWTFDNSHSEIGFSVRHAGISKTRGKFTEATATATVGESLADSSVQATIKAASFDSGDANRDGHVRGADFFDVEQFPELTFSSTSITAAGETYALTGDLTIRGISHPVTFDIEFNGVAVDPFGATRAGFSGKTTISRKEFGLTWNAALEAGGVLVGDKVTITIEAEFTAA